MSIRPDTLRQDIFEVQIGLKHSGHDPGALDGWWGPKTAAAADQMLERGSQTASRWAIKELQEGLRDLGWYAGEIDMLYGPLTEAALASLVDAGGVPKASYVAPGKPEVKPTSLVVPVTTGKIIQSGHHVVDTIYLHTTATPGNWWKGKTPAQMMAEVRRWHTDPKSSGGNGWSDVGYQALCAPSGEIIEGRPMTRVGAGVLGHNQGAVHITMVPIKTITRMGTAAEFYTTDQITAVRQWIANVMGLTPIRRLAGHNEDANKLCPGFHVIDAEWTARAVA